MLKDMGDDSIDRLILKAKEAGAENIQQLVLASLLQHNIAVVVRSGNEEHLQSNINAKKLISINKDLLLEFDANQMVDDCAGLDEYASVFKRIGS